MLSKEIRELALSAAQKYYDYAKSKSSAIAVIPVKKIENEDSFCILTLSKDLLYEEFDLSVFGKILEKRDYNRIKYDDEKRQLYISFNITFDFPLTAEKVHLETNLLFLIESVRNWYKDSENLPKLPLVKPSFPSFSPSEKYTPSDEQLNAISNIKSHPLSYIWGAPGTGKTQFVLARCIADYIKSNKKILVCAPTNNALEQILFGVFKVLEAEGISTDKVLRLGMPSKKFCNEYPNSCEKFSIQKSINQIEEKINELSCVVKKRKEINEITELSEIFNNASNQLSATQADKENIETKKADVQKKIDSLTVELSKTRIKLYDSTLKHTAAKKKSRKLINRFNKSRKVAIQYEYDLLTVELHELKTREEEINQNIGILNETLKELSAEMLRLKKDEDIKREIFAKLKKYSRSEFNETLSVLSYLRQIPYNYSLDIFLSLASEKCTQSINSIEKYIKVFNCENLGDSEIQFEIEKLKKEHEQLIDFGAESRMAKANVIALTVDKFILDYQKFSDSKLKDKINHIFIDEAAYLSMIKGLILFSLDKPITLLGDHMQLPPVFDCCKNYIDDNPELNLWEIPIIYCEEIFINEFDSFLEDFQKEKPLTFLALSKANLNTTHRFGSNLARVLAGTVYSDDFRSAKSENPTKITVINAARVPGGKNRVSPLEVFATRDYVNSVPMDSNLFAVLTPYKNQSFELQNVLALEANCMTIHKSQGQEWDTVILSTVDTFMASNSRLINTAVSRAKKHLVIVCDAKEWKLHPKQLITKIISIADRTINFPFQCSN